MVIKKNKKLNRRGFSLAEAVIALALISIVSVATLTIVLTSQRSTYSAMQKQQAQIYAADIITCYRNDGDFHKNVNFALGLDEYAEWSDTVQLNGGFVAKIVEEAETSTLMVTVLNEKGKELIELSFTKGGQQ